MMEIKTIWKALIPIRSGSKSIKNKNISFFCGKPLFYWATQAAIDSGIFNGGVFVTSDNKKYLDLVQKWTPLAIPLLRPSYTSTDDASSESVMEWFLKEEVCDVISLVQVTTPTVSSKDFQKAKKQFEYESVDSLLTAVLFQRFLWTDPGKALNYNPLKRPRRQDMEKQYLENGSFYFTKTEIFNLTKCRLAGKILIFEMSEDTSIEIDEPNDWVKAEKILQNIISEGIKSPIPKILIIDVDGTLTDGGMYYGEKGEIAKKFNTRDGAAIDQFRKKGFSILVCTGEQSPAVDKRIKKLKIGEYLSGVKDKEICISKWLKENSFNWSEVLYVGDELNDLIPMKRSAFSVCPNDSHPKIKDISTQVMEAKGGEGVLRDVLIWVENTWPKAK